MRGRFSSAWILLLVGLVGLVGLTGCGKNEKLITIYTSVDQDYSKPIIDAFQAGHPDLEVKAVYDSELTKTTGLYTRILQEKENPQADVFWNSEILRTIQLKQEGALAPYVSPSAQDIPEKYKDPEGYWTGFSGRLRVVIVNTDLEPKVETQTAVPSPALIRLPVSYTTSMQLPTYKGKCGFAQPEFGTTAAHMAGLYTLLKEQEFTRLMESIKNNEVKILPGNASVRDEVAGGRLQFGLTDSDDFFAAKDEGKPVRMEYPDQPTFGTLLIPNTVSLVRDAPNPEKAKLLVDYLLSPDVEARLAQTRARQIPLRPSVNRPEGVPDLSTVRLMEVDYTTLAQNLPACLEILRKIF